MCCAFNSHSALRDSSYSDLVKAMQGSQHEVKTGIKKIRTGLAKGLTVWLDQHGDKTSFGTVFENYNGFKVTMIKCVSKVSLSNFDLSGFHWSARGISSC